MLPLIDQIFEDDFEDVSGRLTSSSTGYIESKSPIKHMGIKKVTQLIQDKV